MDPRPPRLMKRDIWEKAEDFRQTYIHNEEVPVDIEIIMQSALDIDPIPIEDLQRHCYIDGFISLDFKYIYIDKSQYCNKSYYKRVRFTIAHEIGHWALHKDLIEKLEFKSIDDWIEFRLNLQESPLGLIEWQAREFAGRLLVPINHLVTEYKMARNEVLKNNMGWDAPKIDDSEMFSLVAPQIAPKFDVSTEVIEKRLDREEINNYIK
jgi:Zn-dependent peptidase ImmA (M78 family)